MFKCDKVGDINELRRHIDVNPNPNTGDNMSNRFNHNGIKLSIKKVDSDFVCFAKKDGKTKHFCEETDHASIVSTVKAEIAKGIDWDQIPS